MDWIIGSGLRFGRLVVALAIGLTVIGIAQLRSAPVDVYPEFMPPSVEIQTEALGLSAAEVEQLITLGLEQDLLNGVPWLDRIHSSSMPGLSVIDLTFQRGTDLYAARQQVQERLTQAHALPNVGSPPIMIQPTAAAGRIAMIRLSSSSVSPIDMSVLARWKIKPRLMGVPGVANVAIYGQRDRQLQVQVDPKKLRAEHVTLTQLIETAGNALWVSPLTFVEASTPGTGGFFESANQRLSVQHISPISTPRQLAAVPVQEAGKLRLGDVANVIEDHQPLIGDAGRRGAGQGGVLRRARAAGVRHPGHAARHRAVPVPRLDGDRVQQPARACLRSRCALLDGRVVPADADTGRAAAPWPGRAQAGPTDPGDAADLRPRVRRDRAARPRFGAGRRARARAPRNHPAGYREQPSTPGAAGP
jgi:Cu/Ag efflux pump CusA